MPSTKNTSTKTGDDDNNNSNSNNSNDNDSKSYNHGFHILSKSIHRVATNFIPPRPTDPWEALHATEKRRRAILLRVEEPFWKILTYYDGTVLDVLITDPLFYATCAIYVVMRILARYELPSFVSEIGSLNIGVLGGFLSFFLVFWVNQTNQRYFDLYNKSMSCKGRIFDTASIVVTALPKERAFRLIRYMNAAQVSGYTGMSKTYPASVFFTHINEDLKLLTDAEMERMNDINLDKGCSCNRELIAWCMQEVAACHKAGLIDHEMARDLRDQILRLRADVGQMSDALDLPIPFFYVHFIALLTVLYLPLFAITTAVQAGAGEDCHWAVDVVAGLIVVLQTIFVIGLRILGQRMSDPYGDDLIDLSVMWFVNFTWTHSQRILMSQFPPDVDAEEEQRMAEAHVPVGEVWSYSTALQHPPCKLYSRDNVSDYGSIPSACLSGSIKSKSKSLQSNCTQATSAIDDVTDSGDGCSSSNTSIDGCHPGN